MIDNIYDELITKSNPSKAKDLSRFFKTGLGEYGEGDKFIGLTVPTIRSSVNKYSKTVTDKEITKLVHSPFHELRLAGLLVLVKKYLKSDPRDQEKIYEYYLANLKYINNWDLIDLTAPHIVGRYLQDKDKEILYQLAISKILWERRISILSTFTFIRSDDYKDAIAIAEILLHDDHDLIHKAVGWMLREIGKRDLKPLLKFLDEHARYMPRTMLRYAIEKLSDKEKYHYMHLK